MSTTQTTSAVEDTIATVRNAVERWKLFWFEPADPLPLGIIRFLTGTMLVYNLLVWGLDLPAFFGAEGLQPVNAVRAFYQNDFVFSFLFLVGDEWLFTVHWVCVAIAALFCLGVLTRVTSILAFLITISYSQRVPVANFGLDQILGMLCLYLAIGPSGACLSIDSWLRRKWMASKGRTWEVPQLPSARTALRLIQIHLCMIYFWAGFAKLKGDSWWTGEAMWQVLANREYQTMDLTWMAWVPWLPFLIAHVTVAWEVSFCVLVWNERLRPIWLAIGTSMHFGIGAFLGMWTFGLIMTYPYFAFSDGGRWRRRMALWRNAESEAEQDPENSVELAAAQTAISDTDSAAESVMQLEAETDSDLPSPAANESIEIDSDPGRHEPLTEPVGVIESDIQDSQLPSIETEIDTEQHSELPDDAAEQDGDLTAATREMTLTSPEVADVADQPATDNQGFFDSDDSEVIAGEPSPLVISVKSLSPMDPMDLLDSASPIDGAELAPLEAIAPQECEPEETSSELFDPDHFTSGANMTDSTDSSEPKNELATASRMQRLKPKSPNTVTGAPPPQVDGRVEDSVLAPETEVLLVAAHAPERNTFRTYLRRHDIPCRAAISAENAVAVVLAMKPAAVLISGSCMNPEEIITLVDDINDMVDAPVLALLTATQIKLLSNDPLSAHVMQYPASLRQIRSELTSILLEEGNAKSRCSLRSALLSK